MCSGKSSVRSTLTYSTINFGILTEVKKSRKNSITRIMSNELQTFRYATCGTFTFSFDQLEPSLTILPKER